VNSFGADSLAGAGLFNWKEDFYFLHHQENKVVLRYENEHGNTKTCVIDMEIQELV
jgi:hypothetical protein